MLRALRLGVTFVLGGIGLGLIWSQAPEYPLLAGLALVYLLWVPWKPVRLFAELCLLVPSFLLGWLGLIIVAGGPDSRGPDPWVAGAVIVSCLAALGALGALFVLELRVTDEAPGEGRLFRLLGHAAALGLIAWGLVEAGQRGQAREAAENRAREQRHSLEAAQNLSGSERFRHDNEQSLKHVRGMSSRQWRALESDTRAWVRTNAGRLPEDQRPAYEAEWEKVFEEKSGGLARWRRLFNEKPGDGKK